MINFLMTAILALWITSGECAEKERAAHSGKGKPMIVNETNNVVYTNEQRLLIAIPQLTWTRNYMVEHDWLKPGQIASKKDIYFSRKNCTLLGLSGEIQILFELERLYSFAFYVESDEDFSKLYHAMKRNLPAGEKRSGDANSGSRVDWKVEGMTSRYDVALVRRVFGKDIERSLEIAIAPRSSKTR